MANIGNPIPFYDFPALPDITVVELHDDTTQRRRIKKMKHPNCLSFIFVFIFYSLSAHTIITAITIAAIVIITNNNIIIIIITTPTRTYITTFYDCVVSGLATNESIMALSGGTENKNIFSTHV